MPDFKIVWKRNKSKKESNFKVFVDGVVDVNGSYYVINKYRYQVGETPIVLL